MKTRIYEVPILEITLECPEVYLVEAGSQAAAERHVATNFIGKSSIATPKRIVELMGKGIKVETPSEEVI